MQNLQTPSFRDRLQRIGYLLKHTMTVVGRDTDILAPWIRMNVYALVMVTVFFAGVTELILGSYLLGWIGLGLAVLLYFYKFLFYNYREVAQSWLVFETICGRDRTYKEAHTHAKTRASDVRKLAGLDLLMAYLMSQRGEGKGWTTWLVNLILEGLEEVWDLVNHYMLPAVAVDELTLTDGVKQMKTLRNQVPETLTGVFGIDFIGRIITQVTFPLYFLLFVVGVGTTYLMSGVLPEAMTFTLPVEDPLAGGPLMLNALPLLVAFYIGKVFSAVFERTVTSIKVIYFTIFYTQITHAEQIDSELQPQLVSYLRMEEEPSEDTAPATAPDTAVTG